MADFEEVLAELEPKAEAVQAAHVELHVWGRSLTDEDRIRLDRDYPDCDAMYEDAKTMCREENPDATYREVESYAMGFLGGAMARQAVEMDVVSQQDC